LERQPTYRTREQTKGIFCLEGDWWGDLKKPASVEPMLQLLESADQVPFIHRDVDTRATFEHYLGKWAQETHRDYPILYLAFHGEEGQIIVGDRRKTESRVSLEELGAFLKDACSKRVIHFGSCSTLALHGNTIKSFLRKTQALAVMGYEQDVDWMDSTAYDLLALAAAQDVSFTIHGANALVNTLATSCHARFGELLGFRLEVNSAL
jgi:hypothetical protein